ncbi:hypothetical protein [Rhodococcoides trifolii]|uniref:hypothetical protein n=1 Tax=Rhodococcoides trifolii TaxID=908250 RepID=UPI001E55CCE2|nr:hypothetical protein [Rhodococcus trifolii]
MITPKELRGLGVSASSIVNRCLPDGPWQRLLPGIVLLHNGPPSDRQRMIGALTYGGPGSILTGLAGLVSYGYRSAAPSVAILVPHETRRKPHGFVEVDRTRRMPELTERGYLQVAPVHRCVVDAVRRTKDESLCLDLLVTAVQRGGTSIEELAIELSECTTRGTALPRRQLHKLGKGAHSAAEVEAHELYEASDLPPMHLNRDVLDAAGNVIARPDGWLDDVGLAWEIDSLAHHLSVADHERTMLRRSRMQSHGIVVVSHLPKTVRQSPNVVIRELRAAYELAASRPRPNVRMRVIAGESGAHSVDLTV